MTIILIAEWENPCAQVVLGIDSYIIKEPLNAEIAVRTTGPLTAGGAGEGKAAVSARDFYISQSSLMYQVSVESLTITQATSHSQEYPS